MQGLGFGLESKNHKNMYEFCGMLLAMNYHKTLSQSFGKTLKDELHAYIYIYITPNPKPYNAWTLDDLPILGSRPIFSTRMSQKGRTSRGG